jgi:phosphoglycolate phosphatase-like HAD superfamily hydrolase
MLLRAARDLDVDLGRSWMIGDSIRDTGAGRAAGTGAVMVMTGYGLGERQYRSAGWAVQPDHFAGDLLDAVGWILARDEREKK